MRELCSGGTTVLLTTHYLDEAEHLADRVGVLAAGRLVAEGTPEELIGGSGTTVVALRPPARHDGRRPRRRACPAGAPRRARPRSSSRRRRRRRPSTPSPAGRSSGASSSPAWSSPGRRWRTSSCSSPSRRTTGGGRAVTGCPSPLRQLGPPRRLPGAAVHAHADRGVLRDPAAADHARAVQRPVRRQHRRHRLRASGRRASSTPAGWPRSRPSRRRSRASPTRCRSAATRASSSGGGARRERPWVVLGGMIGSSIVLAAGGVVVMIALGVVAYDLDIDAAKMPAMIVTFLVGVASFAAMGMAVAGVCPNAVGGLGAGQRDHPADGVRVRRVHRHRGPAAAGSTTLGDVLPLKPFAQAFQDCFNPAVAAAGVRVGQAGPGRRVGRRSGWSLRCGGSGGSLPRAARRRRRRRPRRPPPSEG